MSLDGRWLILTSDKLYVIKFEHTNLSLLAASLLTIMQRQPACENDVKQQEPAKTLNLWSTASEFTLNFNNQFTNN